MEVIDPCPTKDNDDERIHPMERHPKTRYLITCPEAHQMMRMKNGNERCVTRKTKKSKVSSVSPLDCP
jgi:hypothetical protein